MGKKKPQRLLLLNDNNLKIADVCSLDETRPAINRLHVTPEYTEATNGFCMIRVTLPTGFSPAEFPEVPNWADADEDVELFDHILIPRDVLEAIKKTKPKKPDLPILGHVLLDRAKRMRNQQWAARMAVTDLQSPHTYYAAQEFDFPDSDAVWPTGDLHGESSFDATLIAKVCSVLAAISGNSKTYSRGTRGHLSASMNFQLVYQDTRKGEKPPPLMRIEGHNKTTGQDYKAIIMPVRYV